MFSWYSEALHVLMPLEQGKGSTIYVSFEASSAVVVKIKVANKLKIKQKRRSGKAIGLGLRYALEGEREMRKTNGYCGIICIR